MASGSSPRVRSPRFFPGKGLDRRRAGSIGRLRVRRQVRSAPPRATCGTEGGHAAWAPGDPLARGRPRGGGDLRRMTIEVRGVDENVWEIPRRGGMRVPGRIFATATQMQALATDPCLQQVVNVAHLPGLVGYALAMPDIHWGYGFPIGGVAATNLEEGVVSPGGVGYDINCGVRLARTRLAFEEVRGQLPDVVRGLLATIPTGVGAR